MTNYMVYLEVGMTMAIAIRGEYIRMDYFMEMRPYGIKMGLFKKNVNISTIYYKALHNNGIQMGIKCLKFGILTV